MRWLLPIGILPLVLASATADGVDYTKQVKPLLAARCASCHGVLAQKAKLRLDTAKSILRGGRNGPAIVPGKSGESLLIQAVLGKDRSRMPPEKEGAALSAKEIDLIRSWIDQGATAPDDEAVPEDPRNHWAFRKPTRPAIPHHNDRADIRNPIDAFLLAQQKREGLVPRPEADRPTLLRRVTLDLIGIPPTREQLRAFLEDDSPDAYDKVVSRLVASPRYGERWGRHWMDVWRYSDWYGRRHVPDVWNSAPQIWRWRDWIVRSLNGDHGYDRMVREMLAADEVCPDDYDAGVATGYLIRNWYALNPNDWMRNTVEHTGKAFLGLTFQCAHCHDHKYDPIRQEDYFRFRAFFEPIYIRQDRVPGEGDPGPFQDYKYSTLRKIQRLGSVRIFDKTPDAKTWFYTAGDERNRLTDKGSIPPGMPRFLGGSVLIEPVELPAVAWYPGLRPGIQQTLLADARAALDKAKAEAGKSKTKLAEAKLRSAAAQLASVEARIAADKAKHGNAPADVVKRAALEAGKLERKAALAIAKANVSAAEAALSGEKEKPKNIAGIGKAQKNLAKLQAVRDKAKNALDNPKNPEAYSAFSPVYPKTSTGRRRALAEWITDGDNPLTARVAVNHIWMRHFHQPLVPSVYDFGRNGKPPTLPRLLDWLAVELVESGWSMKHIHRLIVSSSAYRRESSTGDKRKNDSLDPENKLLWRMNTGRMEAEVVRDSLLFCAGKLDSRMGGQEQENTASLKTHRRSLYYSVYPEEGGKSPLGKLFDGPEPLECYRRTRSVVPQQALALTNSAFVHQVSASLASWVWLTLETKSPDPVARNRRFVHAVFEVVLGRSPSPAERKLCVDYLAKRKATQKARESLVRAILNHNDFLTIR